MNLTHDAFRDLTALAELKPEGGTIDRYFLQLMSHTCHQRPRRVGDSSLEGLRMALQVKRMGAWSEEHVADGDNKVAKILDNRDGVEVVGALQRLPRHPFGLPAAARENFLPPSQGSQQIAVRSSVNRVVGERKRAVTPSWYGLHMSLTTLTTRMTRRLCWTTKKTCHRKIRRS